MSKVYAVESPYIDQDGYELYTPVVLFQTEEGAKNYIENKKMYWFDYRVQQWVVS